jgi:hypothetical protein
MHVVCAGCGTGHKSKPIHRSLTPLEDGKYLICGSVVIDETDLAASKLGDIRAGLCNATCGTFYDVSLVY